MSSSRSGRSRPIAPGRRALSTVLAALLQIATTWRTGRTGQDQPALGTTTASSRRRIVPRFIVATLVTALLALSLPMGMLPASAASVSSASFTGDSKTLVVDGMLYAKRQGALTLNVATATAAKCVVVSGDHSATLMDSKGKTSWSFGFTAGDGNGVKSVTVHAYDNAGTPCTNPPGNHASMTASYVLDNAGPSVTASLAPAANGAGWNNGAVNITWDAVDVGVGFLKECSGSSKTLNPCADSVALATPGTTRTSTATDRLGNSGSGSVTVRIDTAVPTITGSRSPAQPASGWNNTDVTVNFACEDPKQGATRDNPGFASGIKSCGPNHTVTTDGANQSVTGKAVDVADNQATATVGSINIDKTAPVVKGAATTLPNDGWYKGDVSIAWTCTEALSGLAGACPTNSTISGEGDNLGVTSPTVSDKAGNSGSGSVSGIKIDRTAPNTAAVAPTTNWNNTDVTVVLDADDALSGVKATYYKVNNGAVQTGTSVSFNTEGTHTLEYWSVDKAGNTEASKTVNVNIDKTKPSINHTQDPVANNNGWNNTNVTVTFTCVDGGSGLASCTAPQTVTSEGKNQPVTGTAVDNAGNTATDPATVSIDKTAPTISASADGQANGNGWYKDDVTVSFACDDTLSGITAGGCTPAQKLGEGGNQSASGTATDAAGNSTSTVIKGINVDKTAPALTGVAQGTPTSGWYNADVNVAWTCSDALSGIDGSCPANTTVTGEGENLGASASVSDKAGNSTSATVSGIKIDRTAPTTASSLPAPKYGAWYAGSVNVTLTATDNLSQVDKTFYSLNSGSAQEYSGPFELNQTANVTFWSVDQAGNVEDKALAGHTINVQIDNTNPSISGSRSPLGNGFGWNNGPVTVSFNCNDLESGLAGCTPTSETLSNEGAGNDGNGQSVTGTAADNVGNSESLTVGGIKIDTTKPALAGKATTEPNAKQWYKDDVTIRWTAEDGLSGIDPATQPADSLITGQGSNLGVGPVNVSDKAGNSTSASVSGIKIDRTAPTINGGPTSAANGAGWYKDPVTVAFTCTDNLSEVATCPSAQLLGTDGANQSVTSDNATDNAGNEAPGKTVGGINLDGTAPKTDADIVCTGKNGFCRGKTATVELTATDQTGLSGVKGIHYKLNNANWVFAPAASKVVEVPLSGSGTATVLFYGEDNAGNLEKQKGVALKYDTIAPTVTPEASPGPNAADWNNSDVTVSFEASDDSDGSGVDPATVTAPQTVDKETPATGVVVKGEAYDLAGNHGTGSVTVKLDKTVPAITGTATTQPNSSGWYTGSVTVKFTCSDALSGIAVCPADVTLTASGQDQYAEGTATDKAGNSTKVSVGPFKVDAEKPVITINEGGVVAGAIYILGAVPATTCTATDSTSGVLPCTGSTTGGLANGVGSLTYTAVAKDSAGNETTKVVTYKVKYRFDGVLQPINDTGHSKDSTISVFKAASTVPTKLQLKRADGTAVQANNLPRWLTPAKGSATMSSVDEPVFSDPATSGSTYRWDSTSQQYIFNWGTTKSQANNYWRVGVELDDGNTYTVTIGLR